MSQNFGSRPPDPAEAIQRFLNDLSKKSSTLGPVVFVILGLLIAWLAYFQVEPGEVGVVRRLGQEHRRAEPGPNFLIPLVESVDVVNVEEIRRIEVGFRGDQPKPDESRMLTGDENIVKAQMTVQYKIADPSKFLFRLAQPENVLHSTAEVALRSVIGRTNIDDAITKGRGKVEVDTKERLQRLMDRYDSGLSVTEVKLQSVDPPEEVRDAFNEVVRAREKKEQLINEAEAYREDIVPRARGKAEQQKLAAEAYKEQRILRAQGDAQRFEEVYASYARAKDVTRRRLYLEAMERILQGVESKTIVDSELPGSTLPVIQLGPAVGSGAITGEKK